MSEILSYASSGVGNGGWEVDRGEVYEKGPRMKTGF